MSLLTGDEIEKQVRAGRIVIDPFDPAKVGANSYDFTLSEWLFVPEPAVLIDVCKPLPGEFVRMERDGFLLEPGTFYLGTTQERVGSDSYVPMLDGRSTTGRYGVQVHQTAGFGDVSFLGHLVLEMSVTRGTWIYPGLPLCQVWFETVEGTTGRKYAGSYQGQDIKPRLPKPFVRVEEKQA